jgi:hypothetical protein
MLVELQMALAQESNVDWEHHFIGSTTVRAHQHAAGAEVAPKERPLETHVR